MPDPKPEGNVVLLNSNGPVVLNHDEVTTERVGAKGFGLAAIPTTWTSPFFIIDAEVVAADGEVCSEDIATCISMSDIVAPNGLLIRSSGTHETLRERGHLQSFAVSKQQLPRKLKELANGLPTDVAGRVHWIIQAFHPARRQGHLSNERRLAREARDWVLEIEPVVGREAAFMAVAVRKWRDGTRVVIGSLHCASEMQIQKCLKQVAMWALEFHRRYHFEWLWDGNRIVLVQMDEEHLAPGVNPRQVLLQRISALEIGNLRVFREATDEDYSTIRKLKNAAVYKTLGYSMPPFFVLECKAVFDELLAGTVSANLRQDLDTLAQRPLVLRTDGTDIPSNKREMLPRSDALRSGQGAADWLLNDFSKQIAEADLSGCSLGIIAHNFIPSAASAWAKASPSSPIVRIESSWGIPESLYWHSHDTFEVDIGTPHISDQKPYDGKEFPVNRRLRHKGIFVGSNQEGRWEYQKTGPKHDWSPSINNAHWLSEIAWTTKLIAQSAGKAVSVMWFVENHRSATMHKVLPWYHEESQLPGTPKAAPRGKWRSSIDFKITSLDDLEVLRQKCSQGIRMERVLVEPTDPRLIRDLRFAEELAKLSKMNKFVIELLGGVLSHVYYVLVREGARVECVDLYGESEETSEFYKLVRDRIPEVIQNRGETANLVQLEGDALAVALRQKLVEEAFEALDSPTSDDLLGELADVLEIVHALAGSLGVKIADIERQRKKKASGRGAFSKGYMLTVTESPHSLVTKRADGLDVVDVISDPAQIPVRPHYRRPDLRQASVVEIEKILALEPDLTRLKGETKEALQFVLPSSSGGVESFEIVLALKRRRSSLRMTVRLRKVAVQFSLPFED